MLSIGVGEYIYVSLNCINTILVRSNFFACGIIGTRPYDLAGISVYALFIKGAAWSDFYIGEKLAITKRR